MDPHSTRTRPPAGTGLRRRDLGAALAAAATAAALPAVVAPAPAAAAKPGVADAPSDETIRVGAVGAARTGGILDQLVADFRAGTGREVAVSTGNAADLYARARLGELDLVLTHLGLPALQEAVSDGVGRWPQLVMASVFAFVAAPHDPAGVAGATGAVAAFERIAHTRSPFVVNDLGNPRFVSETLWHAAGAPDRTGWYVDQGLAGGAAVRVAEQLGGYTVWGLHPFLAFRQQPGTDMRAVLWGDSLLQQPVASVVVMPGAHRRVNLAGALALERHLVSPQAQGLIRRFRHPMFDQPIFWPAAHGNAQE